MIAAGATVRWSKGIAIFEIRAAMRGSARFAVVTAGLATAVSTGTAMRGSTGFAMIATGAALGCFAVVSTGFATGTAMRRSAGFAVVSTGAALGSLAVVSTGLATTAISLPGFTHSFKAFPQCSAFLLAHVTPSLPHGGTP